MYNPFYSPSPYSRRLQPNRDFVAIDFEYISSEPDYYQTGHTCTQNFRYTQRFCELESGETVRVKRAGIDFVIVSDDIVHSHYSLSGWPPEERRRCISRTSRGE